jgi:hypothetical protein
MKSKILEALKAKFEGVSDAVLGRIADKLAKTVTTEDGVQPAVDGVTLQQVIDGEADRRATEATKSAVASYEKKHSLKEGKPVQGEGQEQKTEPTQAQEKEGKNDEQTPAWAKDLIASNKALGEKLTALEGEKIETSRKQKLDAIIKDLPENIRKPYNRISLKGMTEDEFDTFIAETTTEVGGITNDLAAQGSVLAPPKKGDGKATKGQPSKADVEAVVNGII